MADGERRLVSLIVPVYNEEGVVSLFLEAVCPVIAAEPYAFEFIFVNDGSRDGTQAVLEEERRKDARVKIVELARNFGKDQALAAGFKAAGGDAVIPMDVDLQDPPEIIPEFLRCWEEGYEAVVGVRRRRDADTRGKRLTAGLFYRVFNRLCDDRLIPNAGDFRLLDRCVVDALNTLPEHARFMKGLYSWVGFRQTVVYYDRPARKAGSTKWSPWKLWNFALDGITGFSTMLLRIWSYTGLTVALAGFGYAAYLIVRTLAYGVDVPGYASLICLLLILNGMVLISLGIFGEYLGRIFMEVKARPLYIVRRRIGFAAEASPKQSLHQGQRQ